MKLNLWGYATNKTCPLVKTQNVHNKENTNMVKNSKFHINNVITLIQMLYTSISASKSQEAN